MNRDIPIWKNSNLALLFRGHGLDLNRGDTVPVNTLSAMTDVAKDIEVELIQTSEKDWRLVQR